MSGPDSHLPIDLWINIFRYLEFKDIRQVLSVSTIFHKAIKTFPASVPSIGLINRCYTDEGIKELFRLVTNNGEKPIQRLKIKNCDDLIDPIISKYILLRLNICETSRILSIINTDQNLNSLQELTFEADKPLDLNHLRVLPGLCPALNTLVIRKCRGLKNSLYVGNNSLSNLKCLRLDFEPCAVPLERHFSFDTIITSFLLKTPKLYNLKLFGNVFQHDDNPSTGFTNKLDNLNMIRIGMEGTLGILPEITSKSLSQLFITADFSSRIIPQTESLLYLNDFGYGGNGCVHTMEYYGIGENLTHLTIYNSKSEEITKACKRCKNLLNLNAPLLGATVTWLFAIANVYCLKLIKIYLQSLDSEDDVDILLKIPIKNIYLVNEMKENDLEWFLNNNIRVFYKEPGSNFTIMDNRLYDWIF